MRDLEQVWEAHQQALLKHRDLQAALAPLAAEPAVTHIPAMTGASGRRAVERFYADQFLPHVPDDLTLSRISRTVDRWRLVDETTVSFTHDRELPWLLPGVEPTFRRAEVLAIRGRRLRPHPDPLPAGPLGSRHPGRPAGPSDSYCPSSHRPGAMSLRAPAGPHEPGA